MKWVKKNGKFLTYCSECGCEKLTTKRPYNQTMCKPCGSVKGAYNSHKVIDYSNSERNKNISKLLKRRWENGEMNTNHLDEWRNSERNKNRLLSQQKDATKAALGRKQSKPEKEYEKELRKQGIEYKTQYFVENYPFDFYIPSKNLLVEIDGEFYHPLKKEDCVYPIQKHNFKRDKLKTMVAMNNGYKLKRVRV